MVECQIIKLLQSMAKVHAVYDSDSHSDTSAEGDSNKGSQTKNRRYCLKVELINRSERERQNQKTQKIVTTMMIVKINRVKRLTTRTKYPELKKKSMGRNGQGKTKHRRKRQRETTPEDSSKGVVQLFNAVRKQQKLVEEKMTEAGTSERKKTQVMGSMTKGKFLDILKGTQTNDGDDSEEESKKSGKQIDSKSGNKKWDILREDFMMGAKMKDWDKDSSDEGISLSSKDQRTEISDSDDSE